MNCWDNKVGEEIANLSLNNTTVASTLGKKSRCFIKLNIDASLPLNKQYIGLDLAFEIRDESLYKVKTKLHTLSI